MEYRVFTVNDYDAAYELWRQDEAIGLSVSDDRESIRRFLMHNPEMSIAAVDGDHLAGTLLAGTDGRRGYLYHLYVAPVYRNRGIARELVKRSLQALEKAGISRTHLFVFRENQAGRAFWNRAGFRERDDITVCTFER